MKTPRDAWLALGLLLVGCASDASAPASTQGGAAGSAAPGAAGATQQSAGAPGGGGTNSGGTAMGGTARGGTTTGGTGATEAASGGAAGEGKAGGGTTTAGRPGSAGSATAEGGRGGSAAGGSAGRGAASGGAASGGAATASGGHGGLETGGSAGGGVLAPVTIYIAGDSTASNYTDTASTTDQAGWGQMLGALFTASAKVDNHALGGRTARRFIDEGHLDEILATIQAGDFLLVQFGTNDSNKTATYDLGGETIPYYLEPETDFKTYMQKYVDAAMDHGATPAFVTPTPRNSAYCTGGNGTGGWATALRELGASDGVAVLDLNQKTVDYLKAICPSPTPEDFFLLKSDGSVDGTHFQEHGAHILAGFVADEMRRVSLPLAAYLK